MQDLLSRSPITASSAVDASAIHPGRKQRVLRLTAIICLTLLLSAAADQAVVLWLGLPTPRATFRRIGRETGPQIFCAGSSLLQFALSWPEVSYDFGQGVESWGVAGSTPSEWEVFQNFAANANVTIVGVDVYDLNEYRLCDSHANLVSLWSTVQDLWHSGADYQSSTRVLGQYPLSYVRKLFPTVGRSDAVMVGLRRKLPERLRGTAAAEERAASLVMPSQPVMDFGESTLKVSDWPADKMRRRLAGMRSENRGLHAFNGPKRLALERMLLRARQKGSVIITVLPVAPSYVHELLTPQALHDFENVLNDVKSIDPRAQIIRLDKVEGLNSDEYYSDLVHLNGAGRKVATAAFLNEVSPH